MQTSDSVRRVINVGENWQRYKTAGDPAARNLIIEHYLPLVNYIASRILEKLPSKFTLDDLITPGIFGLMEAVESFDLGRGVKFETYGTGRIRGAILDELRSSDWVPRLVRQAADWIDVAWRELQAELGREPSDMEMAKRLGCSMRRFQKLVSQGEPKAVLGLNQREKSKDRYRKSLSVSDLLESRESDPTYEAQRRDVIEFIKKELTPRESLILALYYYENLTQGEIGTIFNLCESRICQLHKKIMMKLRNCLARWREDLMAD